MKEPGQMISVLGKVTRYILMRISMKETSIMERLTAMVFISGQWEKCMRVSGIKECAKEREFGRGTQELTSMWESGGGTELKDTALIPGQMVTVMMVSGLLARREAKEQTSLQMETHM